MRNVLQPFGRCGLWMVLWALQLGTIDLVVSAAEFLPPGFRPLPLGVHALVGAKVVVKPGEIIEHGTVVIRDGLISAVGDHLELPAEARVWDLQGQTIYAGFIDPYLVLGATNPPVSTSDSEAVAGQNLTASGLRFFGAPGAQTDMGAPGPGYAVAGVTPEYRAARHYSPKEKSLEPLRELGFTAGVIVPAKGIIRGTSSLLALAEENPNELVIKPDVFQHVAFETRDNDDGIYPGSLMGVIAVIRQSLFDAQHYALDQADYLKHPRDRQRPEFDPALEALAPALERRQRAVFEPGSALMDDRAARLAGELGLDFCLVSSGQEWRRPDLAGATGASFIVPLNFPSLPNLPEPADWEQVTLDELRAWDWAPENPALLRRQGREIALTTYGLGDKKTFRRNLQLAMDRGLAQQDALAALTTVPAKLCGADSLLGTIEAGKLANLTIVEGAGYFDPDARVSAVWIDGRIYPTPPEEPKTGPNKEESDGRAAVADGGPPQSKEEPEKTTKPAAIPGNEKNVEAEKPGATVAASGTKLSEAGKEKAEARELRKGRVARSPLEGRGPLAEPKAVLVEGATIWTCGPAGRLEQADLLVVGDKVKAVGQGLAARSDYAGPPLVIDGRGLHVTPGLIDCHSHTAILGDVNEATLPSSAMVRIRDVVNSETDTLYEQLAGGVTTVNLLHGSANPIGGQNCVIKLRDGASPEALVFADAPPGIKFALGENVKQSNWGDKFTTRFPQTRMGVGAFLANRFTAAQQYLAAWDACRKAQSGGRLKGATSVPPRRDLELEALGEILQGKRWIHCHAYRQDEMLMLMRLMEQFGVQLGTFQHALEGYKIADEIARHGAGASAFSDWWAYKFEVYDAIPYAGSLMRQRGVLVSFNSDSSELARRLYAEAAKAVKYGGTPETEALKFVTLNPAQQLRIDSRVGSLAPGKDADFALWSRSPLDSRTVCLQTWIEGKKYFDRASSADRAARLEQERNDLLAKARRLAKLDGNGGDSGGDEADDSFFRVSLEHQFDHRDRHCLDEDQE